MSGEECINDKRLHMTENYVLNNGVRIPAVGFGTWKIADGAEAADAVRDAIETGYRLIDGAGAYANEKGVGQGIRESGIRRDELFVTSKVWNTERGYDSTLRAFDRTMSDLGLDVLDLYLIHWPASPSRTDDWARVNADTWRALERLYAEGRVRAIGVSNFMPRHLDALLAGATVTPAVNQIEFHPGYMQSACVEYCNCHGILVEAWSPIGRGRVLDDPLILSIAAAHGRSAAQVCLRWAVQHGIVPLPKSTNAGRMSQNLDIFDFELTDSEMRAIDAMPQTGWSGLDPDKVDF